MQESKSRYTTLEELLKDCFGANEMAAHLDTAMFFMILLLRHEPENLRPVIRSYEALYELKCLILSQYVPLYGN